MRGDMKMSWSGYGRTVSGCGMPGLNQWRRVGVHRSRVDRGFTAMRKRRLNAKKSIVTCTSSEQFARANKADLECQKFRVRRDSSSTAPDGQAI